MSTVVVMFLIYVAALSAIQATFIHSGDRFHSFMVCALSVVCLVTMSEWLKL